jgi:hypothetical protein
VGKPSAARAPEAADNKKAEHQAPVAIKPMRAARRNAAASKQDAAAGENFAAARAIFMYFGAPMLHGYAPRLPLSHELV